MKINALIFRVTLLVLGTIISPLNICAQTFDQIQKIVAYDRQIGDQYGFKVAIENDFNFGKDEWLNMLNELRKCDTDDIFNYLIWGEGEKPNLEERVDRILFDFLTRRTPLKPHSPSSSCPICLWALFISVRRVPSRMRE